MDSPEILIHVLPGGSMPERQTAGAIGYDVRIRAIVSETEMDQENPVLRKTLFDFETATGGKLEKLIEEGESGELMYRLDPGKSALCGIGFVTAMPFPMFYWVAPRSGLASKHGITVTNAPGTVDPDYRGEAGVLVYNRTDKPFYLRRGMRIAQIIFQCALVPRFAEVADYEKLESTARGAGGFGSTGL